MAAPRSLHEHEQQALEVKRVYGGVDRDQRVAERRQRFIEAGIQVFGTAGYHGATVRSLCAAAGLTDRYFYESFASNDDLLCAVYEHLLEDLWKRLLMRLKDARGDVDTPARVSLSLFFETVRDRRVARIILIEVLGASRQLDQLHRRRAGEFAAWLIEIITSMEPRLKISDTDEEIIGLALIGAVMQTALQWMLDDYRMPQARVVENCAIVLVGTVRELTRLSLIPKKKSRKRKG